MEDKRSERPMWRRILAPAIMGFFILVGIACLVYGCNERDVASKIPDSWTVGKSENIRYIEAKEDTDSLSIEAVVPYDIRREVLRPTLLAILKDAFKAQPQALRIWIHLYPDERLQKHCCWAGDATYEGGVITLHYNIPSDKYIADWNAEIGKPLGPVIDGKPFTFDLPPLFRPTAKDIDIVAQLVTLWDNYYDEQIHSDPTWHMTDDERDKLVAQKVGIPVADVKRYFGFAYHYYGGFGGEGERITLK